MRFKSVLPFFLGVTALISNLLTLAPASATQDKPMYFMHVRASISGRSGGGAEDLLKSTTPIDRVPDDATREGAMRAGMQSIALQSALITPIEPDHSLSPLPVISQNASAH